MKTIKLDENWSIETQADNVCLKYKKIKTIKRKNKKTDQEEEAEVTEKNEYHYPSIKLALKKYLNESQKDCTTIQDVLKRIDEVEKKINKIVL